MAEIAYNPDTKLITPEEDRESLCIYANQVNSLTQALISENNPNFSPQPSDDSTKLIRNLFDSGIKNVKNNKLPEGLKNVTLAIEMAHRKRAPWEAFAIQLQELQFMLRHKIDLELMQGRYLDALQDLDMLLSTGLFQPEVFIRKTDALLHLGQLEEARVACDRGLSLQPQNAKLKALMLECNGKLAEYNGL
ncbi:ZYBA0S05-01706g1_1 [Zygosaccharomyces bailii CLIB 213]|uniref:ZYBA0S05-01706g1_1 n=1 Tax=Zygosaccharomyces bailii (strain CLIB 213 / ATCC 58445 / CBS 680 / BCRC 21525 / NBRC 1098 / NCYC 1416 / NRRL Y-2227) TaxID=1333698 RepID=A0A8J2X8T8_ZYGB2|nr:ZYBA0S05-01706g1_1 [Zygosaccharomyces bailii CLIB 213]